MIVDITELCSYCNTPIGTSSVFRQHLTIPLDEEGNPKDDKPKPFFKGIPEDGVVHRTCYIKKYH